MRFTSPRIEIWLSNATSRPYYDGLFRGHPASPYHCAVDDVSYLLVALIQLNRDIQLRKGMIGLKSTLSA